MWFGGRLVCQTYRNQSWSFWSSTHRVWISTHKEIDRTPGGQKEFSFTKLFGPFRRTKNQDHRLNQDLSVNVGRTKANIPASTFKLGGNRVSIFIPSLSTFQPTCRSPACCARTALPPVVPSRTGDGWKSWAWSPKDQTIFKLLVPTGSGSPIHDCWLKHVKTFNSCWLLLKPYLDILGGFRI